MTSKSAQKAYEAYKKSQKKQQKAVNKKAKKKGTKPKKVAGSNYDSVRKKTETVGKQGAQNRENASVKKAASSVKKSFQNNVSNTQKAVKSGAIKPAGTNWDSIKSKAQPSKIDTKSKGTIGGITNTVKNAIDVRTVKRGKDVDYVKKQDGTAKGNAADAYNEYKNSRRVLEREGKRTVTVNSKKEQAELAENIYKDSVESEKSTLSQLYDFYKENGYDLQGKSKKDFIKESLEDGDDGKRREDAEKQAEKESKYSYTKAAASTDEFFKQYNASLFQNTKVKTKTDKDKYVTDKDGNIKYDFKIDKDGKLQVTPKMKKGKDTVETTQGANILDYYAGGFDKKGRLKNQKGSQKVADQRAGWLRDSKFAAGAMQGLSYSDITKGLGNYSTAAAKDVQKTKESGAFNVGYMAGQAGQFMLGGTNKMTDALVKGISKTGAKRSALNIALRKGGADALFESPLNTLDAIKMATDTDGNFDKNAFAKYMALNTGLSGGMGGAIGGVGAKMTQANAKEYLSLAAKVNVGTKLSDEELLKFTKLQDKFESARQGNDIAKADIVNRADYDARVHDEVFSRGGNSVDAEAAMNGATTHSERMSYARTIKDTAEQEFDALRTQREQIVSKLKDASPEEAVEIRKKLAANRQELDRLGGIANIAGRELEIAEKRNRRAVQDLAVSTSKMSENTGVSYRVMNDKDMRNVISEEMARQADSIEASLNELPEAERASAMKKIEELRQGASDDYFYKGFYYKNAEGKTEILINSESPQAHQTVIGHETGHLIKSANEKEFVKLGRRLTEYAKKKGELAPVFDQLKRSYPTASKKELYEELYCELLGRYVYGKDDVFIKQIAGENPSLVRRIIDYLKELMGNTTDKEMSKELKAIIDKTQELVGKIDGDNAVKESVSYKSLVAKDPVKVKAVKGNVPLDANGNVDKSTLVKQIRESARKKGNPRNTTTDVFVKNIDQGIDIRMDSDGIRHGFSKKRGKKKNDSPNVRRNADASVGLPEVVENAIMVNHLRPRDGAIESRVFVGAVNRDSGTYIVRFVADRVDAPEFVPHDFEVIDKLDSAKAKKVGEYTEGRVDNSTLPLLDSSTNSISVADLLAHVNATYPDILSDDVLRHLGRSKDEVRASYNGKNNLVDDVKHSKEKKPTEVGSFNGDNVGYHAGDLGKSESHGDQAGSHRHTGGYGTGTYFVGDEAQIGRGTGYGNRPHEKVNFDDYNLYRPKDATQGRRVHDNLLEINRGSLDTDRIISNMDITDSDIAKMKDVVSQTTYSPKNFKVLNDIANKVLKSGDLTELEREVDNIIDSRKPLSDAEYRKQAENFANETRSEMKSLGIEMSDRQYQEHVDSLFKTLKELPQKSREETYFGVLSDRLAHELDGNVGFGNKSFLDEVDSARKLVPELAEDLGKTEQEVRAAIKKASETIKKYDGDLYTKDSASTLIMKELGFEGVDARGIKSLDNTEFGSVIYELKGDALARKKEIGTARFSKEKITAETITDSTGNITKETDDAYLKAVDSGDEETQKKIIEAAADHKLKDSKLRDENGDLIPMYHSTIGGKFTVFDKNRADPEGNSGAGFYFSSSKSDSNNNYATVEGADVSAKIERRAYELEDEYDADPDGFIERYGKDIDDVDDIDFDDLAEKDLFVSSEEYNTYLDVKEPLYVGSNGTNRETDMLERLEARVDDNHESTTYREDYDDEVDFEADRDTERYMFTDEEIGSLADEVADDLNLQYGDYQRTVRDIASAINECYEDGRMTFDDLKDALWHRGENFYDEDYNNITNEIARSVAEKLGYDGIVDYKVSTKFRGMGLKDGDFHTIVFKPEQIKTTEAITRDDAGKIIPPSERFNTSNQDMRFSKERKSSATKLDDLEARLKRVDDQLKKTGNKDRRAALQAEKSELEGYIEQERAKNVENSSDSWYNNGRGDVNGQETESATRGAENIRGTSEEVRGNGRSEGRAEANPSDGGTGDSSVSSERLGGNALTKEHEAALAKSGVKVGRVVDRSSEPEAFIEQLKANANSQKFGVAVDSDLKPEDLKGAKLYTASMGNVTIGIKPDGDIFALAKNTASNDPRAFEDAMFSAIANGGIKMDNYGSFLTNMYERFGFEPVAKIPFNPAYISDEAMPAFQEMIDRGIQPDVYVMKHNGDSLEEVGRKFANDEYKISTQEDLDKLPVYEDYDEALKYRDSLIENERAEKQWREENPQSAKMADDEYVSDKVKTALKDIREANIYTSEVEKLAKEYNSSGRKIAALKKKIENSKTPEHIKKYEEELAELELKQKNLAGKIEQKGKMKAVDPDKTAKEQLADIRGSRETMKVNKEPKALVNENGRIKDSWTSLRRLFEDSFIAMETEAKRAMKEDKELGQRLLTQINRVRNDKNVFTEWITNRRSTFDNHLSGKALDDIFTPELRKNTEKYNDFQDYLLMKHVPARHEKGTDIWADVSPELAEKRVKELEDQYGDEIKDWAKEVYDYINDLQQYRVDSGLLTKEAMEQFAKDYPFYVPTNRVQDGEPVFFTKGNINNGVRTAKGGESEVMDIYNQLYTATNKTIHAAEENQMLNLYFKARGISEETLKGAELKDLEHAAIKAEVNNATNKATVSFFVDGKPVRLAVDHQVARGLREWDGLEYEKLMKAAKVATLYGRPFKALITDWNLAFGVRNGARDLQQALVNSKNTRYFTSSMPSAFHAITTKDNAYMKLYESMGGKYAQLVSFDDAGKPINIEKGAVDKILGGMDKFTDLKYNPIKYIEQINGGIELIPRLSEFIGTIRKDANDVLKKQGSSIKKLKEEITKEVETLAKDGEFKGDVTDEIERRLSNAIVDLVGKDTIDAAMRNANDITLNFGRSGVIGKALNMGFVPYFNPSIQGLSKLVRMFTENGIEGGGKALLNLGMKLSLITLAPAAANEWFLRDNEDYQNLNSRDKDNNFFIPWGDDGMFIKIPKPRENAVLAEPVEYGLRHFLDNAEYAYFDWSKLSLDTGNLFDKIPLTDEGKQSFRTAMDNIGIINPMDSNMVSPLWQTIHNKTWYGGSIESAYDMEQKSNKRYDLTTSAVAIQLGQTAPAKFFNLSPKKIDNLLDSYTGMIYDLGISQTSEKAKSEGNWFTRTIASQFMKDSVFSNKLSTKAWAKVDGMSEEQQKKYKSTYMYDTFKYDDAMNLVTTDKSLTKAERAAIKRDLMRHKNMLNREAIDGSENTVEPLSIIAKHLGANRTLNNFLPDVGDSKYKTWKDYYKAFKSAEGFKGMPAAKKERLAKKFLDVYSLGVQGQKKIDPAGYHDMPSWGMTGVAAAQLAKQNKLTTKEAKSIMMACDVYESQTETYFKYSKYGGNVNRFAVTQKNIEKTLGDVDKWGIDTGTGLWQSKYDKAKGIKGGVYSMSLATGKADFKDRAYYIANSGDSNMLIKMNAARGYSERYGHSTKQLVNLAKKADKDGNTYLKDDEITSVCNTIKKGKATSEEKAMAFVLLGGNPNKNPFGSIGDYSHKGDTGISMDGEQKSGRGRGRGRGYGGWGSGGGGGSSNGTMPKTESGAFKGKVTDPFATSNGTKASNLNDAYRKRLRKLNKIS